MSDTEPRPVALPSGSRIATVYPRPDLADAFAIDLPAGTVRDPETLARFLFSHEPRWVTGLMSLRDALVALLGLKTGRSLRAGHDRHSRIGIFRLYESGPLEVLIGEDDRHLDFRVSVLYGASEGTAARPRLVLSTVVHCHNLLGRSYLTVIAPFHRLVVQAFLRRAATVGWPQDVAVAAVPGGEA